MNKYPRILTMISGSQLILILIKGVRGVAGNTQATVVRRWVGLPIIIGLAHIKEIATKI